MRLKRDAVDKEANKKLFQNIQSSFPHLQMELKLNDPNVDLAMHIPQQHGLKFAMALNLQDDSLFVMAGESWFEWHPCTQPYIVKPYREAVEGLLSGEYRVLRYYRGTHLGQAKLQRLNGEQWKTVQAWSDLSMLIPWRVVVKELRNV